MGKISTRQICFFYAFLMPVTKLIIAPSVISGYAKNNLLIPVIVNFIMQGFLTFLTLFLTRKEPDKTIFQILTERVGTTFAKSLYFLYGLYFFLVALLPIVEQREFTSILFYDSPPTMLSYIPFFVLSIYLTCKNLKSVGRIVDALSPLFIFGFIGILFLSISSLSLKELLPFNSTSFSQTLTSSFKSVAWFCDSAFTLIFVGNFKRHKHTTRNILLSYLLGAFLVILFYAIFYSTFAEISIHQHFGVYRLPVFAVSLSNIGRIDYLFLYSIEIVALIYTIFPLLFANECFSKCFSFERRYVFGIAINVVLICVTIFLKLTFSRTHQLALDYFNYVFILFVYLLPIIIFLLKLKKRREITYE